MNIEDVIEYRAKQLKEEVGTALNGDECYNLIKDAVYEALESVNPNIVLAPVIKRIFLVEFRDYKQGKEWRDCFIAENETDAAQQIRKRYDNKFTSYHIVDSYVR